MVIFVRPRDAVVIGSGGTASRKVRVSPHPEKVMRAGEPGAITHDMFQE